MGNFNLILGLIVIIAAGSLYYTEYHDLEKKEDLKWTSTRLLNINPDNVFKISFTTMRQALAKPLSYEVTRNEDDTTWNITSPVNDEADKNEIETIVGHLYNLGSKRQIKLPPGNDGKEYGFSTPRSTIKLYEYCKPEIGDVLPAKAQILTAKNSKIIVHTLRLGRRSPVDALSYVQVNDENIVYLVNNGIDDDITKPSSHIRRRTLFKIKDRANIESMSINIKNKSKLALTLKNSQWKATTSFPCPIDCMKADTIADTFRSLKVDFFVEDDPEELNSYGLLDPKVVITVGVLNDDVNNKLKTPLILKIGNMASGTLEADPSRELSGWYCQTNLRNTVYIIADFQYRKLVKTLFDVRDRSITHDFEINDVNNISLTFKDKSTALLAKDKQKWIMNQENSKSTLCDSSFINTLVSNLYELKATGIVSDYETELYKSGLDKPDLMITLNFSTQHPPLTVAVKWDKAGHVYIQNKAKPTSYRIRGNLVNIFPEKRADLIDKYPLRKLVTEQVQDVCIEAIGLETIKIAKTKLQWRLIQPPTSKLNEQKINEWLIKVKSLHIHSFLQEGKDNLKKFGLTTPLATSSLTLKSPSKKVAPSSSSKTNENRNIMISIGAQTANKLYYFAMINTLDAVFKIRKSMARPFLIPSLTYYDKTTPSTVTDTSTSSLKTNPTQNQAPMYIIDEKEKDLPKAIINTKIGSITLVLFENEAPNHVANFIFLAENNFYNKTTFHRVEEFCIQGGDPNSKDDNKANDGSGDPGYSIKDEVSSKRKHRKYYLSMANKGPDTGGCQFFILKKEAPWLDGIHTVFGASTDGAETIDTIPAGTVIESIYILNKRNHEYIPKKDDK